MYMLTHIHHKRRGKEKEPSSRTNFYNYVLLSPGLFYMSTWVTLAYFLLVN